MTRRIKCDECPATFDEAEAIAAARPAPENFRADAGFMGLNFIFINAEGKPCGGREGPRPGDKVLHCPSCGRVHLFGFDLAPEKEPT